VSDIAGKFEGKKKGVLEEGPVEQEKKNTENLPKVKTVLEPANE